MREFTAHRFVWVGLPIVLLLTANLYGAALGVANDYNVFVFGNFSETGADSGGRIAVGGTASFTNTYAIDQSVLDNLTAPANDSLVVDMGIISGNVAIDKGNAWEGVAPTKNSNVYFNGGGTNTVGGSNPLGAGGVAAQAPALIATSSQLSQVASNGTVTNNGYGTITFTGTDPTLDVFNVDISLLGGNNTININDPTNATVIINVTGTSGKTTGAGMYINGNGANGDSTTGASDILFNFYQATSLTLGGSFVGTILAPNASVTGTNSQQLDGGLIADAFNGATEFHDILFTGTLPSTSGQSSTVVPEPDPFPLCGMAVGIILLRRRRQTRSGINK